MGAFSRNSMPVMAPPSEGAHLSFLPKLWGHSGFSTASPLPQGQVPSALCTGTGRECLVSRVTLQGLQRSGGHPSTGSPAACWSSAQLLTVGTRLGPGRVSPCSQNSQDRDHQPKSHLKAQVTGAKGSVRVMLGSLGASAGSRDRTEGCKDEWETIR